MRTLITNSYNALHAICVPKGFEKYEEVLVENDVLIRNILFSASGKGKYEIYIRRNNLPDLPEWREQVAVIFPPPKELTCSYPFQIELKAGDLLTICFKNYDHLAMDMYCNFEVLERK